MMKMRLQVGSVVLSLLAAVSHSASSPSLPLRLLFLMNSNNDDLHLQQPRHRHAAADFDWNISLVKVAAATTSSYIPDDEQDEGGANLLLEYWGSQPRGTGTDKYYKLDILLPPDCTPQSKNNSDAIVPRRAMVPLENYNTATGIVSAHVLIDPVKLADAPEFWTVLDTTKDQTDRTMEGNGQTTTANGEGYVQAAIQFCAHMGLFNSNHDAVVTETTKVTLMVRATVSMAPGEVETTEEEQPEEPPAQQAPPRIVDILNSTAVRVNLAPTTDKNVASSDDLVIAFYCDPVQPHKLYIPDSPFGPGDRLSICITIKETGSDRYVSELGQAMLANYWGESEAMFVDVLDGNGNAVHNTTFVFRTPRMAHFETTVFSNLYGIEDGALEDVMPNVILEGRVVVATGTGDEFTSEEAFFQLPVALKPASEVTDAELLEWYDSSTSSATGAVAYLFIPPIIAAMGSVALLWS